MPFLRKWGGLGEEVFKLKAMRAKTMIANTAFCARTAELRRAAAPLLVPWLLTSLLLLATVGCGRTYDYPYAKEPNPIKEEYVIGVADVLSISVWRNQELNTTIAVRPDGTITMPLVGDVKADGLTPSELKTKVTKRLAEYIKDGATVTVSVTGVNSYYVTVSGQVSRPGVIGANHYLSVGEAVALAGGPTRFASPQDAVLLRRRKDGTTKRIPINYTAVANGSSPEMDLVLYRGDKVHVP